MQPTQNPSTPTIDSLPSTFTTRQGGGLRADRGPAASALYTLNQVHLGFVMDNVCYLLEGDGVPVVDVLFKGSSRPRGGHLLVLRGQHVKLLEVQPAKATLIRGVHKFENDYCAGIQMQLRAPKLLVALDSPFLAVSQDSPP